MKNSKKVLAVLLVLVMAFSMVGCGESSEPAGEKTVADMKIGVIQLAEHVALDAAREGFVETLIANGFSEENIDIQNAQGEQSNCATIATKFVNDDVDLILAIATPAAQAAAMATSEIPVLVTAVTDPAYAGLVESNEVPGGNVSGTSDMGPVKEQMDLLLKFVPDAKKVSLVYCSAEDNSILQAEIAEKLLVDLGIEVETYTAADTNEIQSIVQQSVANDVDAIYIPTDNLFAANMGTVALVANPNKIPVICGEAGMVAAGGLATHSFEYKDLGVATAQMAIDILLNGADISTMPIGYTPTEKLFIAVNEDTASEIDIEIPQDIDYQ